MTELGAFLLPAIPLLFLVVPLLLGRYPGCEAIVRLAERIAADGPARPADAGAPTAPRPRSFAPGGGLLLALSLSGRAPPARA
ncbi:MAG TPA: hypothetical protein VFX45_03910 [Solirubrobacterales bacterium]|nr:hypothetical protein [Solirubrobacterales bacterium]